MRWLIVAAFTFMVVAGGCGVHVGNGMRDFKSKHGFEMQYSEKLNLQTFDGGNRIVLNNADLVEDPDEVSKMEIRVEPNGARPPEHLLKLAHAEHRRDEGLWNFNIASINGTPGVTAIIDGQGSFRSRSYVVTPVRALLRIAVDAFAAGDGLSLFKPIVGSIGGSIARGFEEQGNEKGSTTVPQGPVIEREHRFRVDEIGAANPHGEETDRKMVSVLRARTADYVGKQIQVQDNETTDNKVIQQFYLNPDRD